MADVRALEPTRAQTMAVLIGVSIMLTTSMGMRQSWGLFIIPMTKEIGVSVADFTLAIAIQNLLWGFTQPLFGAIADKYGCRVTTMIGAVLYAAGLAVTMYATGPLMLILGMGILIGLALSCTGLALALAATAKAVSAAKRSVVLGTVSAFGSIGTFVAAFLAQGLIEHFNWQIALIGFIVLCAFMLPACFLAGAGDKTVPPKEAGARRAPDADLSLKGVLGEAARHGGYITMSLAFFVCGLQLVFLTTHLPAYLKLCGQSPELGATALGVIGGFNALGCYVLGWLGGKFPKHVLLGIVYILRSLSIVVYFMLPASPESTVIFAAIMGLLWLGVAPLVNGLVANIFGLRYVATLTGIAFMSHQVGSFLGAWGGGLLFDAFGTYDLAWQIGVAIGLAAGVAQIFMNDKPTVRMTLAQA